MTIHLTMIKLDLHSIYSNTGKWMAHHRLTNPRSQLGTQKNLKVEIWWVNIINSFKSLIHQFWKSLDSSEGVLDPLISSISSLHFQFFILDPLSPCQIHKLPLYPIYYPNIHFLIQIPHLQFSSPFIIIINPLFPIQNLYPKTQGTIPIIISILIWILIPTLPFLPVGVV